MDLMALASQVRSDEEAPHIPNVWKSAELLKAELQEAGFQDVVTHRVLTALRFQTLEDVIEKFLCRLPYVKAMLQDFSEVKMARLRCLWLQKGRTMAPHDPGQLTGTAIIAVGRKEQQSRDGKRKAIVFDENTESLDIW